MLSLEDKCKLYFMVYRKLLTTIVIPRGNSRTNILPATIHREALKRTNHILAALGEKLDIEELLSAQINQ